MSNQHGNVRRKRPQKYQNRSAFKNNLHDKSKKTEMLNSLEIVGCCQRCKEIIEWKIKYKKYKTLTIAKKCTKCQEKTVKRAYYIMCDACSERLELCGKCGKKKEISLQYGLSSSEEASQRKQLELELKFLPERKRRTFFRLHESGQFSGIGRSNASSHREDESEEDEPRYNDLHQQPSPTGVQDPDVNDCTIRTGVNSGEDHHKEGDPVEEGRFNLVNMQQTLPE